MVSDWILTSSSYMLNSIAVFIPQVIFPPSYGCFRDKQKKFRMVPLMACPVRPSSVKLTQHLQACHNLFFSCKPSRKFWVSVHFLESSFGLGFLPPSDRDNRNSRWRTSKNSPKGGLGCSTSNPFLMPSRWYLPTAVVVVRPDMRNMSMTCGQTHYLRTLP